MIYRISQKDLLDQGLIKKCPVDKNTVKHLLRRAHTDIKTAVRNLKDDEECTYNYAYNAMLRSGLALMFSKGYRPEIRDKHLTVVKFVSQMLGEKYGTVINNYDYMRRKRHRFIYEPGAPCSKKEARDALKTAKNFVDIIARIIERNG